MQEHNDVYVDLIQHTGGDASIVHTARVSTLTDFAPDFEGTASEKDAGLINYLMREKHGSPFEHNSETFRCTAGIFVFREFMRHRIPFSYNEQSARYTRMLPDFYIPGHDRPLVNSGTSAKPVYDQVPTDQEWEKMQERVWRSYEESWDAYEDLLGQGIAPEVARLVLPVGIMSSMYVTANLRGWMNFLSLRTHEPEAAHVSRPQREIEMVARKIEAHLTELFPVAMECFNRHGRVAP